MSTTIEGMETPPRRNRREGTCTASPFTRKERTRCLFCGGDQCKRCSPTAYLLLDKPAIPKLHSSWINDSILAMQRPSDIIFESGVLDDFKKAGITAVFNLTEPGEHPYCGTGILDATGFPYSPEKLMAVGIKHFNFHWPDMTAPSIALMTEIAHIGTAELNGGGKIAVHCHAGFGRTGMAIACILIFKDQVESTQVIQFIRNRRPGSIQTSTQERFIRKFEKSFRFLMQSFPTKDSLELSASAEGGNTRHQQHRVLSTTTPNNATTAGTSTSTSNDTAATGGGTAATASPSALDALASDLSPLSSTTTLPAKQGGADTFPTTATTTTTTTLQSTNNNTSLYLKTLQQSAADQHYLLNTVELQSKQFLRIHKIVYFTTLAISTLSKDHVLLAHLGFTGLNKLIPKENFSSKYNNTINNINNALITASNYMVATNSMTQGLEETLLTDIKLELNTNKWTRFMSVADVVAISLKLGQESVKRLTKVVSIIDEKVSPTSSSLHKQQSYSNSNTTNNSSSTANNNINSSNNNTTTATTSPQYPVHKTSMFRTNSFKETSDADYNKSRRVSANIMTQLLLDWLETRQNCIFDVSSTRSILDIWMKHYPNFGQLGWASAAWRDMKSRNRAFKALETELLDFLHTHLDVCRQEVLGCIVSMYGRIHRAGCALHSSSSEGEDSIAATNTTAAAGNIQGCAATAGSVRGSVQGSGSAAIGSAAPIMDTLVALRLAIALMHARKQQHLLVRNRALNMELIKLFMLKHTDTEVVIINNITFTAEHAEVIMDQLGRGLIHQLEAVTRTLLVLQEINWSITSDSCSEYSRDRKIRWRDASSVEQFIPV